MKIADFWDKWFRERPEYSIANGIPVDQCVDAAYADAPAGVIEALAKRALRASLVTWLRLRGAVRVQGKDAETGESAVYAPVSYFQTQWDLIEQYVVPQVIRMDSDEAKVRAVVDEWLAAHPEVTLRVDDVMRLARERLDDEEREAA